MNSANQIAEAILVDAGRVLNVGSTKEIKRLIDADTAVTDLQGKTVMPGIVDAHSHFPASGLAVLAVDLSSPPVASIRMFPGCLMHCGARQQTLQKVTGFSN